ncbi:MAG TPA: rod shape-determining protein MreD [Erythrobacter sp.]|nr:rod shape-determining protein MreD [Erythrobacter sp.]
MYGRRTNRVHSPTRAALVPYVSVMLGSVLPTYFIFSTAPLMPPLGFMILIAWRITRPRFFPLWIGVPLGAFDDLFSGQPFGSAILLWSLSMLVLEIVEARFPWRGFWQDWLAASLAILAYLLLALPLSGVTPNTYMLFATLPQILLSILLYPLIVLFVLKLDRFRLRRIKEIY